MSRAYSPGPTTAPRSGAGDLAGEITALSALDAKALRELWVTLCGAAPPRGLSRPLLIRALAYRIQERALGGLKASTRRLLMLFADDDVEPERSARPAGAVAPGTVLVRQWHGTLHRVTVLETACAWRGGRYRSLSAIARAITGTRWSGPRFFGLGCVQEDRRNGTRHR